MVLLAACSSKPKELGPLPSPPPKQVDAKPDVATNSAREQELAKLAASYVDAFNNSDPTFAPGGKKAIP